MKDEHLLENREQCEHRELSVLLKQWQAPEVPGVLDARIAEVARRQLSCPPLWRRLLIARIPVPAPVAALALVLLSVTTLLAVRSQTPAPEPMPPTVAQAESPIKAPPETVANPIEAPEADSRPIDPAARKADPGSTYVTQVDLTGFEPVKELKIRILPRENNDER